MKTYKFRITESQKAKLTGDIHRFNILADKLGCDHATLTVSEAVLDNDPHYKVNTITDVTWHIPQIKFFDCELVGGFVVAGDYTFIGSIHYSTKEGETSVISMDSTLPTEYKDSLPVCDHCKTKRKRKITFIMKSNVDGSIMQVGSTCLKDFLGYDVSDLVKALKFTMKFADIGANYPYTGTPKTKAHKIHQYGVTEILMLTNAVIRVFGWHSMKSETHIPTADIVRQICDEPESHEAEYWLKKVNESRNDPTDSNMAAEVSKWITEGECHSDYMYGLRSMITKGMVTTRQFGMICSAVNSFKNEVKRKLEAQAENNNEFVGTVGQRMEFEVKCIDTKTFSGYHGETVLYKMVDKENHQLGWFSSSDLVIPNNRFIKIKGTVKKHETFRHVKQTILTRVARVQ